jgi:WD40 repeat protein
VETFAMSDFDQFERRLAVALRSDADLSVARFDPASIARAAIVSARPRPFRGRLGTVLGLGRPTVGLAYFLVVLALVLALIVGAIAAGALRSRPVVAPGWTAAGKMAEARNAHTATLLPDGKVLVAGGSNGASAVAAELYDPSSGLWAATGSMAEKRAGHTATLLPDGKVLVAGGVSGNAAVDSAELYDPSSGLWVATGRMAEPRSAHTATLLPDGRVLVVGGFGLTSAELYDPRTGTWTRTGPMHEDRGYHTATPLPDGKVLVAGGFSGEIPTATASAELYDPASGTWAPAARMIEARAGQTAVLLPGARVLIAGGSNGGGSFQPTASAELYDHATGSWARTGSMSTVRVYAAAGLLSDGTVLVAGGSSQTSSDDPVSPAPGELYDPVRESWTSTARMIEARSYPTATLLQSGKVLVTGGRSEPIFGSSLASAELYDPGTGTR